jgi:membrane associated rhomboid family serine protease
MIDSKTPSGTPDSNQGWDDILPRAAGDQLPGRQKLREWELVLTARGVRHALQREAGRWRILVPEQYAARALEEIRLYEQENTEPLRPREPKIQPRGRAEPTIWIFLLLAAFDKLTNLSISLLGHRPVDWKGLGSVNVWAVTNGEWWRLVTGLSLHSGPSHLFGNMAIGAVFLVMLSRELGSGQAWLLVLGAGTLGNGINALVQPPMHTSLGFSTAVFGCLGLLAGIRALEYSGASLGRQLLPLGAGLGLLGMLGAGGERTDLGAHLFGFAAGAMMGMVLGWARPLKLWLQERKGATLGLAAAAFFALAWLLALTRGRLPENI